jgi:hypothetical protein
MLYPSVYLITKGVEDLGEVPGMPDPPLSLLNSNCGKWSFRELIDVQNFNG